MRVRPALSLGPSLTASVSRDYGPRLVLFLAFGIEFPLALSSSLGLSSSSLACVLGCRVIEIDGVVVARVRTCGCVGRWPKDVRLICRVTTIPRQGIA